VNQSEEHGPDVEPQPDSSPETAETQPGQSHGPQDDALPIAADSTDAAVLEPAVTPVIGEPGDEGFASVFQSLAVTIVIAVFVITFIVQAFQIPSESMENTLLIGDYLLVDKAHYGPPGIWSGLLPYSKIHRGDIIVFRFPIHPSQHFVKRVIGVPGDHVKLIKKRVFVNDKEIQENYAVYKRHDRDSFRDNFPTGDSLSPSIEAGWYLELRRLTENGELIVPSGCYFVMGDNREESLDSRYWGFVPQENVIGRPLLIYWSVQRRDLEDDAAEERQDGKLARFTSIVVDAFHNMRWNRTLRIVR